jgi:hypothetical protein
MPERANPVAQGAVAFDWFCRLGPRCRSLPNPWRSPTRRSASPAACPGSSASPAACPGSSASPAACPRSSASPAACPGSSASPAARPRSNASQASHAEGNPEPAARPKGTPDRPGRAKYNAGWPHYPPTLTARLLAPSAAASSCWRPDRAGRAGPTTQAPQHQGWGGGGIPSRRC